MGLDTDKLIRAAEAQRITEESDVSFNNLLSALSQGIKASAALGNTRVAYPETDNASVRTRLNVLLRELGYKIIDNPSFPGDAISWDKSSGVF